MELALQQEKAKQLRADIVKMTYLAKSGHPGGSLSCVEMLMALYYNIMKVDPSNPGWKNGTASCSGKAACPALYAVLATRGISREDLWSAQVPQHLQGHPDMRKTPGVTQHRLDGTGVSIAGGMALPQSIRARATACSSSTATGERLEGLVWEAAMSPPTITGHTLRSAGPQRPQIDGPMTK
jgi:transketolase